MSRFSRRAWRAWRDEAGVASVEFVMAVPILMAIFVASFESGMFMVRSIMLEQSLDMVMRELRLGHYKHPTIKTTDADLKREICKRSVVFPNCEASLKVNLTKINMTTFVIPNTQAECTNRSLPVAPAFDLVVGQENELMLIQVCMVQDALFPLTGIGLALHANHTGGGYKIIAASAFAVEPS